MGNQDGGIRHSKAKGRGDQVDGFGWSKVCVLS